MPPTATAAPPVVLTIAGFDPSSGAGITADIKTIAAHDCYGVSCITALTVQSTRGVRRVKASDPALILETLEELVSDVDIAAVHVGMLANLQIVETVANFLRQAKLPHTVLDPILKSSSGADLLDSKGARHMLESLIPQVEVITPNLSESSTLTGLEVTNLEQMREAANRLHQLGAANVVITGGHLDKAIDLLSFATRAGATRSYEQEIFKSERIRSNATHGTGCAFATAMACHLAHGRGLPEAVLLAKVYVSAAIANAHPLGHGEGPLHHLYRSSQQRRPSAKVAEKEMATT